VEPLADVGGGRSEFSFRGKLIRQRRAARCEALILNARPPAIARTKRLLGLRFTEYNGLKSVNKDNAMPAPIQSELADFHYFIGEQLKDGGAALSPEEALEEWRAQRPVTDELKASVAAVERALQQAEEGQGTSLEDFDRQFRERHKLPSAQ
jgi:hypothetical protein